MNFIVNNQEHFQNNSAIHNVNTESASQTNCQPLISLEECIVYRDQNLQQSTIMSQNSCK
jgi:hypothetical protein